MSLSHQTLSLEIQSHETSATLTFPQRELKEYVDGNRKLGSSDNLKSVQRKIHPGVSEQQFIRQFNDDNTNSKLQHQTYEAFESAFASMSHYAFAQHKSLTLRPDDFHLLIIQGFARFLQEYPEVFRSSVVAFAGKKQVKIFGIDPMNIKDWDYLPKGFAGLVKHYLSDSALADVLLQAYSESTASDATAKAVTLMGTFSAYFSYAASTLCYIPKFILQGTVEDWEKLANLPKQIISILKLNDDKNQRLPLALLHRWLNRLLPIVGKMLEARKGVADAEFWNSFYKFNSHSGSNTLSGYFVYFYPFLKNPQKSVNRDKWGTVSSMKNNDEGLVLNQYIMGESVTLDMNEYHEGPKSSELPANIIHVDLKLKDINERSETIEYDMGMKAGIVTFKEIALQEQKDTSSLHTHVDYSIFFKSKTLPAHKLPKENPSAIAINDTNHSTATTETPKSFNSNQIFTKKKITFELEIEEPQTSKTL